MDCIEYIITCKKYEDIKGFCKIVSNKDLIENEYSLAPGKYVGFVIEIDDKFDYQGNISRLKNELLELSEKSKKIINQIKNLEI